MSDEAHIEAAFRHADLSVLLPWHSMAPDEEVMAREEGESLPQRRAAIWEALFVYLFADGEVRCWENVAVRAMAVMKTFALGELAGRDGSKFQEIRGRAMITPQWPMEKFAGVTADPDEDPEGEERRMILTGILRHLFPRTRRQDRGERWTDKGGSDWLKLGVARIYLLARQFQPALVRSGDQELTYEELARIFEDGNETEIGRARSRSKWSARAQEVIRKPIENAGGTVRMQFGKSQATREKYREAAMGNSNRKKTA